ncbi:MAG TPA: hypothetical protein VF883_06995 [Thermoanaerobaculia bacterium]|jgi:hypothetical protein
MWRPRDRERFIGSYDPEHEMPDPDRGPGDRWQSDAYRHASRDSRYGYRMNPDRYEDRFDGRRDPNRDYEMRWQRDGRDMDRDGYGRAAYGYRDSYGAPYSYDRDYERPPGYGYDPDDDRDHYRRGFERGYDDGYNAGYSGLDRNYDRGPHYDRDRIYGSDRGWDNGRDRWRR